MQNINSRPIGIFDSGVGGLTVARAVKEALPHERIIYFGDIAHLPYGDKSEAAIQAYSVKITDILLAEQCKVVLIACNSASSAAYELLKAYAGSKAKIINVIDPMVAYVTQRFPNRKIGLIGTKRTVQSNIYQQKIENARRGISLVSLATPLLVPMIEEGFLDNKISDAVIARYLDEPALRNIEGLILGCTHYPLIQDQLRDHYQGKVPIIDSSTQIAAALKGYLMSEGLLSESPPQEPDRFLVSDYTEAFESVAKLFFRSQVQLEKYALWE